MARAAEKRFRQCEKRKLEAPPSPTVSGMSVLKISRRKRSATTLIELLIATAILLTAVAALGSQAGLGVRSAERAQLDAFSTLLCQSLMDEALGTQRVPSPGQTLPVPNYPSWRFRIDWDLPASQRPSQAAAELKWLTMETWRVTPQKTTQRDAVIRISRLVDSQRMRPWRNMDRTQGL